MLLWPHCDKVQEYVHRESTICFYVRVMTSLKRLNSQEPVDSLKRTFTLPEMIVHVERQETKHWLIP